MSTCYVGCTPPTTPVPHAPAVVAHLAYTGIPVGYDLKLAILFVAVGGLMIVGEHIGKAWRRRV